MASAFLAALIVVVIGHVLPELARLRDFAWFRAWLASAAKGSAGQAFWDGGLGLWLALGVPLLAVALLQWLLHGEWFGLAAFALALISLYYAWGPRDLDLDAEAAGSAEGEVRREALNALTGAPVSGHDAAVVAVVHAALARWFGVLFWFVALGAVGAIAYRLVQLLAHAPDYAQAIPARQHALVERLALLMDWPAAHLMTLALALAADFDRVAQAWRDWHAQERSDVLATGFLAGAALSLVREAEAEDGADGSTDAYAVAAQQALALCWRVLIVWLVVLALMVLAGYIS